MPQMNGQHFRSFSQAAHAMPKQGASEGEESGGEEPKMEGGGRAMMVTEHGDGAYSTKSRDKEGKVTKKKHANKQEMMDHMDSHFGGNEGGEEDHESEGEGYGEMDGGNAMKSILG